MAVKWKGFSTRERKDKIRETHTVSPQEIHNIVSREVTAASMKNQVIKYMDDVNAQGIRTEAVLGELMEACSRIEELVKSNDNNSEQLETVAKSVEKISELFGRLEISVHRDNLISYKNLKEALDLIEENNQVRARKLKKGITVCAIMGIITIILIVGLALINLGIISVG